MAHALTGSFPVDAVLGELREALQDAPAVVLEAPPGAGKTTRIPIALLDAPWLGRDRIVMLEPRRLAARAAATFMARSIGEPVGETVGYRVRNDVRVSARTRIEVVTEGILTRQLLHDPSLDGVGVVLFDEFHERSLHADTGLALVLESQQALRPSLRLVVMSATLDGVGVQGLLARATGARIPLIQALGRSYPVDISYRPAARDRPLALQVAAAVRDAITAHEGDLLVFLPGVGEIQRAATEVARVVGPEVAVHPLHGTLPTADQDAAIAPAPSGVRKVVLATSIAETSLTIDGVRVVIDSGLSRVPRFSARTGMTRLETARVTLASATQRAGRAGRTAPGHCVRLWDSAETAGLVPHGRAEILDADLSPLLLDLASAGIRDLAALAWLDEPPPAACAQARALLQLLGALDHDGRITDDGQRMIRFGTHPRLARLLLTAEQIGHAVRGARLAALLEERDVLRIERRPGELGFPRPPVDLAERLLLLEGATTPALPSGVTVDRGVLHRVREQASQYRRRVEAARSPTVDEGTALGLMVAAAYPDRIAQRREGSAGAREVRWVMRSGQGAVLESGDSLSREPWLVIADLDGQPPNARVYRAVAFDAALLDSHYAAALTVHDDVTVDESRVRAVRETRLGAIVVRSTPLRDVPDAELAAALARAAVRRGIGTLPWSRDSTQFRERLRFLHARGGDWPDVSDAALSASVEEWLAPQLLGARTLADVARVSLATALRELLDWQQRAALDTLAPTHLEVPTGSRIPLDYSDPEAPVLAVRLQEVFGWSETPRIHRNEVAVVLHLLSPAHRPVQVTRDLARFWRTSYFDVKKEMKGRYPRHVWPDDPMTATPTRRAKPRGT